MTDNSSGSCERELFEQAREIPTAEERAAFLESACGPDVALRQRIEDLLLALEAHTGFLPEYPRVVPSFGTRDTRIQPDIEKPGDRIGPYKLREQIGEGGCGAVYVAEQEAPIRRRVALKIIKLGMDTKSVIARFEAERQALAMMDHPNIAKVLDAGATDNGRPFFVMELVRGIPITKYCDENHLTTPARLHLFTLVCHAVQHAHQKGIIHRDLKPSNILVTLHDGVPVPMVIDFGIAKAIEGRLSELTIYTELHQFIGTPAYTSPEQAEMSGLDIDTRSDIYSLGVLLYELLTGKTPFDSKELLAAGLDAMRRIIREQDPVRPSMRLTQVLEAADARRLNSSATDTITKEETEASARRLLQTRDQIKHLRGDLDWVVMKCLEKDRSRRYETADGLAADVQHHLNHEAVDARPASTAYRVRKFVRRNKVTVAAFAAIVAVMLVGITASTWQAVRATRAEEAAKKSETAAKQSAAAAQIAEAEAKTERDRAIIEKKRADEQAAIATAVKDFLQNDLLRQSETQQQIERGFEPEPNLTVKEALRRAAEKVGERFIQQPLVEAEIRVTLGRTFRGVGEAQLGIPHLERSVELQKQLLAPDDSDRLNGMTSLAYSYTRVGRHTDALPLFEELRKCWEAKLGHEHTTTLTGMNNLAATYQSLGRLSEALPLFEETLNLRKARLGSEHFDTLATMADLASAYSDASRLAESLPLLEETLKLRKKSLGRDHRETLSSMGRLASTYQKLGRLSEALPLLEELLKLRKAKFGPEHSDTVTAMARLGSAYSDAGRFAEAIPLLEETLKFREGTLGRDHPETLSTMGALAWAYTDGAGRHAEALGLFEEAVKVKTIKFGRDHPSTLTSMGVLAMTYDRAGRQAKALPLFDETLALMKAKLGPDHPQTLGTMGNLAWAYLHAGKLTEALPLFEETHKLRKGKLGPDHNDTLDGMHALAYAYSVAGRHAEALPLHEEAFKLTKAKFGAEYPRSLTSMADLAEAYTYAGRFPDAILLFEETLKLRKAKLGPDHRDTLGVMLNLGAAYSKTGRLNDAESLLKEALERRRLTNAPPAELASAAGWWGNLQLKLGRFTEAETVLRECLGIHEKHLPDNYRRFYAESRLGEALLGQKKFAEAEPLLRSGYEGMKVREAQLPASGRSYLRAAVERLVKLYEAKGDIVQTAAWKQKLAEFEQAAAENPSSAKPRP